MREVSVDDIWDIVKKWLVAPVLVLIGIFAVGIIIDAFIGTYLFKLIFGIIGLGIIGYYYYRILRERN
jgi:hypothetical protein